MDKVPRMSEPAGGCSPSLDTKQGPRGADAREALLAGFARLALSRRYRDFGVDAIARTAKVARSTFYYHFRTKDDLLLANLQPFARALGAALGEAAASPELGWWTAHFWQHRGVAARLLVGRIGDGMQSALTAELRAALLARDRMLSPDCAAMRAEQIAGSTMALLRGWIAHRFSASSDEMAVVIWQAGRALAATPL